MENQKEMDQDKVNEPIERETRHADKYIIRR